MMTIRVYRVTPNGDEQEIRPRREVEPLETVSPASGYLPCACPRHDSPPQKRADSPSPYGISSP
ncbi:hypothetical protein [Streptomyces sp. NPDC005805]|uniref:hypothetical protein n=1 Tax=Streptomyces sp. NPDC005805 TaxID=3157068 RepID=UPI0033F229FD